MFSNQILAERGLRRNQALDMTNQLLRSLGRFNAAMSRPASEPQHTTIAPTPLDWTAAWLMNQEPGLAWLDARRAVMATLAHVRANGEASLSPAERRVYAAWQEASRG